MATNVVIGGKTLNCAKYKMATNVVVSVVSLFPAEPSSYSLTNTYTSSTTFTAPANGYYQIEVQGASGTGGGYFRKSNYVVFGGGGGGGGGCAISRVQMNKGDTIVISIGGVGSTTKATINSSRASYSAPQATSGGNGSTPTSSNTTMSGGAGGVGSNGNYANYSGGAGGSGVEGSQYAYISSSYGVVPAGGPGGSAGYTGGQTGGTGGGHTGTSGGNYYNATSGSAGFVKIYAGNTNA